MVHKSLRRCAAVVVSAIVFGTVLWRMSSHQDSSDKPAADTGLQKTDSNSTDEEVVPTNHDEDVQQPSAPSANSKETSQEPFTGPSSVRYQIGEQHGDALINPGEAISDTDLLAAAAPMTLRMSELLQRQCEVNLAPMVEQCSRTRALLQEMSSQRRSKDPADKTEANLRTHIRKVLPDAQISILECRETLCAVQLGSARGYLEILTEDEQRAVGSSIGPTISLPTRRRPPVLGSRIR